METFEYQKAQFFSSATRSLFLFRFREAFRRVTGPGVFIASLDQPFEVVDPESGASFFAKTLLVPVGAAIEIKTNFSVGLMCFLNDIGTDFRTLLPNMRRSIEFADGTKVYSDMSCESEVLKSASKLLEPSTDARLAFAETELWINGFRNKSVDDSTYVDERVTKALSIIKENVHENQSVSEIAKAVNLSVPRLTQLFRETTGTSIRTIRLWMRMFKVSELIQDGASLTDAAVEAGFTDYAQCFRVYKEMGGCQPAKTRAGTAFKVAA